jgi:leader peptidase (prepilin peptidase)/N-methyltransferase
MAPIPEPAASIVIFVVGMTLGSFLNVCILRLPHGASVARPGSHCPVCKAPIRWYHNVPVVSWLILRGRCADCSTPISPRYALIETMSGAVLLSLWLLYGPTPAFAVAAVFALAMVVLFFTDLDHQLLPDAITLTGVGVGLALAWVNPFLPGEGWARIWSALGGAALGSGMLWGIGELYSRLRGVEAMGMGDVKMMAMVGAFAGPAGVLFTVFFGSLFGALIGVLLIPLRGRSLQDTLPFGCFLAPAAGAALLFGRDVVRAYVSILVPVS